MVAADESSPFDRHGRKRRRHYASDCCSTVFLRAMSAVARGGAGGARGSSESKGADLLGASATAGSADGAMDATGSGAEGSGAELEPVNIKVKVNVAGKSFTIPCGRGQQSVKWLATVVAQRYRMMTQNKGVARHRERQLDPPGFFLPDAVTIIGNGRKDAAATEGKTPDVTFPSARVRDVCASDAITEVDVQLSREYELEEDGSRKQTTWSAMAFNFSDAGRRRAEAKRRADVAAADEVRRAEEAERAREEQAALDEMAKLLATDMDNPAALEEALSRDWTHVRVERITHDADQIDAIKRLLLKHFVAISDIYRVYSAFHPGSSSVAMCKQEFNHVAIVCQIADTRKDRAMLERIFVDANGDRNDDPTDSTRFLTRFEFMEALLALAHWKYTSSHTTPAQAVEKLFDNNILPRAAKMAMGTVRKTLASPQVVNHIHHLRRQLRAAFDHYKNLDSDDSPESMFSINFSEFVTMLKDCNMVDEDRRVESRDTTNVGRNVLTNQEIQELFAAVQRDSEEPSAEEARPGKAMESLQELVFGEFLEAVARCGMETWEDHRVPLAIRMIMGFDTVVRLVRPDGSVGPLPEDVSLPEVSDYFDIRASEQEKNSRTPFVTQGSILGGLEHILGVE